MDNRTDFPPLIWLPESGHRRFPVHAKVRAFADPAACAVLRDVGAGKAAPVSRSPLQR